MNRKMSQQRSNMKSVSVIIDSSFRDTNMYTSPSRYVYHLPDAISNVKSIELIEAVYDRIGTDKYVNLQIDECVHSPSDLSTNSQVILKSFASLPLAPGGHICTFAKSSDAGVRHVKLFDPPIGKFGRMSVTWRTPDGKIYPIRDHFLRFDVSYDANPRSTLSSRAHELMMLKTYDRPRYETIKKQILKRHQPQQIST